VKQIFQWRPSRTQILIFVGIVAAVGMLWIFIGGYYFHWAWTGFGSYTTPKVDGQDFHARKTLWDWMQLLIIPTVLASAALLFNMRNAKTQLALAEESQRESALQRYFDEMSKLLLEKGLRESKKNDEVRKVARARTISVLRTLDGERKGMLLKFLYESQLINKTDPIIDLSYADLEGANLQNARLGNANLSLVALRGAFLFSAELTRSSLNGASLREANLSGACLEHADLKHVDLIDADLSDAVLDHGDLTDAFLAGTNLSDAQLSFANLTGANLSRDNYPLGSSSRAANLANADLSRAKLSDTNLIGADLTGADLSHANLTDAKVTQQQLAKTVSLEGTIMPDGERHK